jgi:hypothetical protein
MENQFHTPILFLIFNRLDTAEQVFSKIRERKPAKLYVAADGPRADRPGELEKCLKTRALVERIDWECEVKTLFRSTNLGCKVAVSSAIDWFFENEEKGIILEDDCLPHPDFFPFCQEMLSRYSDDQSVFAVSGSNIIGSQSPDGDYFFSLCGGIWGWASWRRAWKNYSVDIRPQFSPSNWERIRKNLGHVSLAKTLEGLMRVSIVEREVNTWDFQWLFIRLLHGGKSIIPNSNLISNIGFTADSTHTAQTNHPLANLPVQPLPAAYRAPGTTACDIAFDAANGRFFRPPLHLRLWARLRKLVNV